MSNELSFLIAFATVFGASEAIKQIQSDARRKEHRSRTHHEQEFGHPFAGYYLPYPDSNASGLVSTICDEPPVMNWIYVDRWSYELKFGNRAWADDNWPVPWDCSRQERRLTFGGWEGFLAVKEGNFWALYFDIDEDHLKDKVPEGTPVLEIELMRVEMRIPKPQPQPQVKDEDKDKDKTKAEGAADGNGANGTDGANGANGTSGVNGVNGVNGNSGPDEAGGSKCQNGAYMTPPPEEPLESLPVD
ncbi:hypothetical protein O1611_g9792 [Lasiodiplodia mahajangana]|uniref:Uncharacterized protein n=1 Tax=Lasiodiplodia mahajangana TaxID=1108764 RepID=A0ACC2J5H4_9PEZI|nr:hypothetical protein O1611_g9792 [Lasiodiplodia mahajangana]